MGDNREEKGLYVGVDFTLAGEHFSGLFCKLNIKAQEEKLTGDDTGKLALGGKWKKKKHGNPLGINTFLGAFESKFLVPKSFDFQIDEIGLIYVPETSDFQAGVTSENYGKMTLLKSDKGFSFRVEEIPQKVYFHSFPLIGRYFEESDSLALHRFGFKIKESKIKESKIKESKIEESKIEDIFFDLNIGKYDIKYGDPDGSLVEQNTAMPDRYLPAVFHEETNTTLVLGDPSPSSPIHWMNVGKTFGPVRIVRLGIGFKDGKIVFAGDIDIKIACLTFYLIGLSVAIKFGDKKLAPSFGISGLGINFTSGSMCIVGEVLKDGNAYSGLISVRVTKFGMTIMGTYAEDEKASYMFAYGALHMVLGGPPCFVVTGLSIGFGMNKKITLPEVNKIRDFPLIAAAMGNWNETDPTAALEGMKQYITDQIGETLFALGMTFTTFQMINTCLVGLICFGNENQIALMGQSDLELPKGITNPFVKLGIGIIAAYNIDHGVLTIDGAVSDGSYIFCQDCIMKGGFAWYMWFKGDHGGDFVLTIGGYHKDFNPPNHYPLVDRVEVNWNITTKLSLDGNAYMALTPSCIMAGGALNLTYVDGRFSAWVRCRADMYIAWLPFSYDVQMDAAIGASLRLFGKTHTLETCVGLHMWGPDFSIELKVKIFILTVTIKHVQDDHKQKTLKWEDFSNLALGVNTKTALSKNGDAIEGEQNEYVELQISNGKKKDNEEVYVVNKDEPLIELSSKIPISVLLAGGKELDKSNIPVMNVFPMGQSTSLTHKVTITISGDQNEQFDYDLLKVSANKTLAPGSLWGNVINSPPLSGMIDGVSISFPGRELPPEARTYKMEDIEKPIKKYNEHKPKFVIVDEDIDYNAEISFDYKEEKKTIKNVKNTCKIFSFDDELKEFINELDVQMLFDHPEDYFMGNLIIKETGKKGKNNE